jgi:hypothetical protein
LFVRDATKREALVSITEGMIAFLAIRYRCRLPRVAALVRDEPPASSCLINPNDPGIRRHTRFPAHPRVLNCRAVVAAVAVAERDAFTLLEQSDVSCER